MLVIFDRFLYPCSKHLYDQEERELAWVFSRASQYCRTAALVMVLTCILVGCDDSQSVGWAIHTAGRGSSVSRTRIWRRCCCWRTHGGHDWQGCCHPTSACRAALRWRTSWGGAGLEWGGSLPGGKWQVQEWTGGVWGVVVGVPYDAGQWSSPPCWSAQGRPAQRRGQQGGIILVNLSTRLTRNLKTSHKILVGSPALCRENKLWAKYHRSKVLVTRIKLLSQEMNKCHRNKVPGRRIEYLLNKYILFFRRRKFLSLV